MKVLKVCIGEWKNASRDKRELTVCRELGAITEVVAKGASHDWGRVDKVDGFTVYRLSTRLFPWLPTSINRAISIFTWAHYVRGIRADIISGHDIEGLTISWLSTLFQRRRNRPALVYDSHEFELGRNVKRNRVQWFFVKYWERFLIKRSAFMIVVNDSIADEVTRIHHLKKRPVVARNTPNRWTVDEKVCAEKRREILATFNAAGEGGGVPPDVSWHDGERKRN